MTFKRVIKRELKKNGCVDYVESKRGRLYSVTLFNKNLLLFDDECMVDLGIFDCVEKMLKENNGKVTKGSARDRLGEGNCTYNTLAYYVGKNFYNKNDGDSMDDPFHYIFAVLKKYNLIEDGRGYITKVKFFDRLFKKKI